VLAYIRVLANPDDEVSARRIVNVPKRGIGDTSVARLAAWAQVNRVTFSEAIDRAEEAGLAGKALRGAEQLSKTLAELRPLVSTVNPADFIQLVADRTGYMAELVAEHSHEADGASRTSPSSAAWRASSTTWSDSSRRWRWWRTPTIWTVTAPGSRS